MAACLYFKNSGQAYLDAGVAPAQCRNYIVIQKDEYDHYQAMYSASTAPFELSTALAAFSFFYTTTMIFYFFSKQAGVILEKLKRPLGRG